MSGVGSQFEVSLALLGPHEEGPGRDMGLFRLVDLLREKPCCRPTGIVAQWEETGVIITTTTTNE